MAKAAKTTTSQPARPAPAKAAKAQVRTSKRDTVIALLGRPSGATLVELIAATSWQPHSVRAFLTSLRKSGLGIVRTARDGATCYAISEAA